MTDPFDRPARPWDLFNKNLGRVSADMADTRLAICRDCPLYTLAGTCTACGCVMALKVKLPNASCPEDKWEQVRVSFTEET